MLIHDVPIGLFLKSLSPTVAHQAPAYVLLAAVIGCGILPLFAFCSMSQNRRQPYASWISCNRSTTPHFILAFSILGTMMPNSRIICVSIRISLPDLTAADSRTSSAASLYLKPNREYCCEDERCAGLHDAPAAGGAEEISPVSPSTAPSQQGAILVLQWSHCACPWT